MSKNSKMISEEENQMSEEATEKKTSGKMSPSTINEEDILI
jgi:hypothetical protein